MRTADPLEEAWEAWLYTEGKRTGQTQARQHRAGSKAWTRRLGRRSCPSKGTLDLLSIKGENVCLSDYCTGQKTSPIEKEKKVKTTDDPGRKVGNNRAHSRLLSTFVIDNDQCKIYPATET